MTLPLCPECQSEHAYEMGALLICPMCGHEWSPSEEQTAGDANSSEAVIKDANGNQLNDGDSVVLVKSVRVSGGGGGSIKVGTKVNGIRLIADSGDGHDIEAKVSGFGRMKLKSSVVKRA